MRQKLTELITQAVETLKTNGVLDQSINPSIAIERCRDLSHGDYASNLALILAKSAHLSPRKLAEQLISAIPQDAAIVKIEPAGPGFINFLLIHWLSIKLSHVFIRSVLILV